MHCMFSSKNLILAKFKNAFLNSEKTESQTGNSDSNTEMFQGYLWFTTQLFTKFQAKIFIIWALYLCFNSDVKNRIVWPISEIHCSVLTVTFASALNYWKTSEYAPVWSKIIYRNTEFWLKAVSATFGTLATIKELMLVWS